MKDSKKVPIHVTPIGQRYVKVEDLIRKKSVQETLKKMTDLSVKHTRKDELRVKEPMEE